MLSYVTMTEIAERSGWDRRLALGVVIGMGYTPELLGTAWVLPIDKAERVIVRLKSYVPRGRKKSRISA